MKLIKPLIKILTDPKLIEMLDKNKDGRVSWSEVKQADLTTRLEILGSIALKYVPVALLAL